MTSRFDRLAFLLLAVFTTAGCEDHTVLTGPDAAGAAEQFQARVAADDGSDTDERLPLIYVDGARVDDVPKSVLQSLSPGDIDRIEVVKGCAAMSLTGPDARHGMIVIYTKAYEGEYLDFEVEYQELGEWCRRERQREQARALIERNSGDWPSEVEPIGR